LNIEKLKATINFNLKSTI